MGMPAEPESGRNSLIKFLRRTDADYHTKQLVRLNLHMHVGVELEGEKKRWTYTPYMHTRIQLQF